MTDPLPQPIPGAPADPIATAEIGGHNVEYFKEPGMGDSAPPEDKYRNIATGEIDYATYAGDMLNWACEKAVQHGIIMSAFCREVLALREANAMLLRRLDSLDSDAPPSRFGGEPPFDKHPAPEGG